MHRPFFLVLLLLFSPFAVFPSDITYLQTLIKKAKQLNLAEHPEWHALLHYKSGLFSNDVKSLVDSPHFFNSPQGKTKPQAELESTLVQFFLGKNEITGEQHPQCAFIGRYHWLKKQLNFDPSRLPERPCSRFYAWFESLNPQGITLIFPTAYLNNPASMFGHTLLRIDAQDQNKHTRLLAYTVNFAAQTNEENGLLFAIKGIFGGYPGVFSIAPYYIKVKEYSDIEDRDIWEYPLKLTKEEIERLLRHVWELGSAYFDYFFFDENCSYHLLSLLEVARPGLKLTDQFRWWAIPIDTVRAVSQQPGLLGNVTYRPSRGTILQHRLAGLTSRERREAKKLANGKLSPDAESLQQRPAKKQAAILELASDYVDYRQLTQKSPGLSSLSLALHTARSRIPVPEKDPFISTPGRPDQGHKTARIALAYGYEDSRHFMQLAFRPAYHDLLDPQEGYIPGAQIEFLNSALRYYMNDEKLTLEHLKLIDIVSLSPRDQFIKPLSWKLNFGAERKHFAINDTALVTSLNGGVGLTYKLLEDALVFGFLESSIEVGKRLEPIYRIGAGPSIGIIKDMTKRWRVRLLAGTQQFFAGDSQVAYELALEQRVTLSKQSALRFRLSRIKEFNTSFTTGDISYQWYF